MYNLRRHFSLVTSIQLQTYICVNCYIYAIYRFVFTMAFKFTSLPNDLQRVISEKLNVQDRFKLQIALCKREKPQLRTKKLGVVFKAIKRKRVTTPDIHLVEEFYNEGDTQSIKELCETNARFNDLSQLVSMKKQTIAPCGNSTEDTLKKLKDIKINNLSFDDVNWLCQVVTPETFDSMELYKSQLFQESYTKNDILYNMTVSNEQLFEHILEKQYFGDRTTIKDLLRTSIPFMCIHSLEKVKKIEQWFHPLDSSIVKSMYERAVIGMHIDTSEYLDLHYSDILG